MTTTNPRITLKAAVVLSLLTGCALTGATLYLANIPPHAFTPLLIASLAGVGVTLALVYWARVKPVDERVGLIHDSMRTHQAQPEKGQGEL